VRNVPGLIKAKDTRWDAQSGASYCIQVLIAKSC